MALVVRGDTNPFRHELKALGGLLQSSIEGGPGWIFPKSREADVTGRRP